jgi:hypothetical protein
MDWSPVLTVVATGLVTLGGVWLNSRSTERNESRKIAAEAAREAARQEREDEAARAATQRARVDESRRVGQLVADIFAIQLESVRAASFANASDFEDWWNNDADIKVRQIIAAVRDDGLRTDLTMIVDALNDFENYSTLNWLSNVGWQAEHLIKLAFEIGSTMAREQNLDEAVREKLSSVRKNADAVVSYFEDMEEARRHQSDAAGSN